MGAFRRGLLRLGKTAAALTAVGICLWCGAVRLGDWAEQKGADALLLTAGLRREEPSVPETSSLLPEAAGLVSEREELPELPDDGIVPFHDGELPRTEVTPDPNRTSLPVTELTVEGGTPVEDFHVKDTSGAGLDLAEELLSDPAVHLKKDGRIEVLIYHTHTSEAYLSDYTGFYYTDMDTRTRDRDRSVTAVGEEIRKVLESRGIGAVHDATVNDAVYNGSYSRSWEVLQKNLEEYPSIQVTLDVHRDSMTTEEGVKYKPTVELGGRKAAQIMFLAGCDADGEWGDFPDWQDNLHLALRLQQTAERLYPGLARPLDFSDSKYNMNATPGSLLVEVGTEVNTVSEARYSGRLIGMILAETLLEL